MGKNKTAETQQDVLAFVEKVENEKRRDDAFELLKLFKSITGFEPKMWGPSIIGFGKYHYKYESGHEGYAPLAGFSPRKDSMVIYMAPDFKQRQSLLSKLGKCRTSVACIYVKKIEDIDLNILQKIIENSVAETKRLYPARIG